MTSRGMFASRRRRAPWRSGSGRCRGTIRRIARRGRVRSQSRAAVRHVSVVKSFGPTVFMNFGPGRKRLQIASGASGVAESCGLGQAVAGAAETVRGTLRVAGNGAGDSRAQRLGSGEHAAGGLAFGVDRTRASPWRLRQGPLEPLRGNVVGSFLDTLTVLPPRGGTGRTVTPSGALRVDGDTLWGVSVSRSGEFHMSVIGTGWIGGSGARVFLGARGEPR